MQLIRLDRELTGELLLRHPEKFSVSSVVGQLKGRRDLQHWYLGLLFDRSPEMYGAQEYAPFHALQVIRVTYLWRFACFVIARAAARIVIDVHSVR